MGRTEGTTKSWREALLVPLIVGLTVAAVSFGLPRLFREAKQLSYALEGPSNYLADPAIGHVKVEINGLAVHQLYAYKIRLWNSGDIPLKALPVAVVFTDAPSEFRILSVSHATSPQFEFGQVQVDDSEAAKRRFTFDLLNPGDQDVITVLATDRATPAVFSKVEGLKIVSVAPETDSRSWLNLLSVTITLVATLASFATTLFERFRTK